MNTLRLILALALVTPALGGCDGAAAGTRMMIVSPADAKASSFLVCRAGIEDAGRVWARAQGYGFTLVESTNRYLQYRIDGDFTPAGESPEVRLRFTLMVIYDDYNRRKWWKRPEPRLELGCPRCDPGGPQPDQLPQLEDQLRDAVDCR